MRLVLAQIDTTVGDFAGNAAKIRESLRRGEKAGAHLVVVPEMALCGYPPRDLIDRPAFQKEAARTLAALARRTGDTALLVGTFVKNRGRTGKPFHNAAVLLHRRRTRAVAKKLLLPTYDVFDEGRHFEPGTSCALVRLGGETLGLSICEDLWNDKDFWRTRRLYREDPGDELVRRGATLIVNISASPFSEGKPSLRRRMLSRLARDGRVPVAYVNLVGGNDELVFDGGSLVLDAAGRVAARAALFEEDFVVVDVGRVPGRTRREAVVSVAKGEDVSDDADGNPLESLRRALVLGIRDYAKKCGFGTAVLGLSGGIDSALVATLAVDALGAENVTGVALPSPYSSEGSVTDARALADSLGIRLEILPIGALFGAAKETLAPLFSGRPENVTEENIQSRLR
ncbi:MAG TPA: nitrilase-related carbon-nitrogen hydrolase, partial [Thermoanaerobaculia bacterium]|nr:nitrilase-related carbon-nitrogen hydrolase [Thermoanaerobaculia bacterium]